MKQCQIKTLEDIEKEKDSLIDQIDKNKNCIEKEISNVVDKLDNILEEISEQVSLNVENISSFRQKLEKSYYSKLESASNSIERSISIFEQRAKIAKSEFKKISVIIFILIISLIREIIPSMNSALGETTQNNTSISSTISSNSFVQIIFISIPCILILLIIYIVYKAYKNISDIDNYDELNKEIDTVNKNRTPAIEMSFSSQNVEVEKSFFDEKKAILSSLITSVGKSIPVVNNIYDEVTLFVKYNQIVEDFEKCLGFYNLVEHNLNKDSLAKNKNLFEELGKFTPADAHIFNDENLWKKIIAKNVSNQLNKKEVGQKFTFSENLILLLYYEYTGEPSISTFREIVSSEKEAETLASILIHSQRLIKSSGYKLKNEDVAAYKYKNKDIATIIREIEPFSLSNINDVLSNSFLTLNYLNSYVEFLVENSIDKAYEPTIGYITEEGDKSVSFERRVVKLAYRIGLKNFNKIDGLDENFVDGFARASLALKFHDNVSLREIVCKCSANDYSTSILYSYFEKIKENDGQKIVSVKQLTKDTKNINFFLNKLEDPDIKFFQAQLKEGQWYDSSFSLLRDFFKKSKEEILEKLSSIDELEILKQSIKSIYQEVHIETIEKSIDAQIFGVYVIMFHSTGSQSSGNNEETLKDIIDKLSIRDLDQRDREKKWEFRDDRKKEEIKEKYKICPKYDFINFSKSTRIGILDKGQSFQDFKKDFLNNVKNILNLKDEPFDIGIIVHKIMPSNHTFGLLDKDGLSNKIEVKDLNAVKYIARLATKIPLEDQVSGIKLEKIDLLKIINEKSFYEILKMINNDIKDTTEIYVLSDPQLKNHVLFELNEKLSIGDFKSLALDLKQQIYREEDIKKITYIIESVLRSRYSAEENLKRKAKSRPSVLSKRFIKSLKNLATIYELQKSD